MTAYAARSPFALENFSCRLRRPANISDGSRAMPTHRTDFPDEFDLMLIIC